MSDELNVVQEKTESIQEETKPIIEISEEEGDKILREYFENDGNIPDLSKYRTDNAANKEDAPDETTDKQAADNEKETPATDVPKEQLTEQQKQKKSYEELQKKLGEQGKELGELRKLKAQIEQGYNPYSFVQEPISHNFQSVNQINTPFNNTVQTPEQEFDFTNPKSIEDIAVRAIEKRIKDNQARMVQQKAMAQVHGFTNAYNTGLNELIEKGESPEEAQKIYGEVLNEFLSNPLGFAYRVKKTHSEEIIEAEKRGEQMAIEKMHKVSKEEPKRATNITSNKTYGDTTNYKNMSDAQLREYAESLDPQSAEYDKVLQHVFNRNRHS